MKKKNGFTLIELLAVIVILAVIALIAVPQVLKILKQSRLSAAEDTIHGIVKAAENFVATELLENNGVLEVDEYIFQCKNDKCLLNGTTDKELDIKGKIPDDATVVISNGGESIKVIDSTIGGFNCTYEGESKCSDKVNDVSDLPKANFKATSGITISEGKTVIATLSPSNPNLPNTTETGYVTITVPAGVTLYGGANVGSLKSTYSLPYTNNTSSDKEVIICLTASTSGSFIGGVGAGAPMNKASSTSVYFYTRYNGQNSPIEFNGNISSSEVNFIPTVYYETTGGITVTGDNNKTATLSPSNPNLPNTMETGYLTIIVPPGVTISGNEVGPNAPQAEFSHSFPYTNNTSYNQEIKILFRASTSGSFVGGVGPGAPMNYSISTTIYFNARYNGSFCPINVKPVVESQNSSNTTKYSTTTTTKYSTTTYSTTTTTKYSTTTYSTTTTTKINASCSETCTPCINSCLALHADVDCNQACKDACCN